MRTIEDTLSLWVSGLLTAQEVVGWANGEIARIDVPPSELIDLSMDGPEVCLKRAQSEFPPRVRQLSYADEFALRAARLDLMADEAVHSFAEWASRRCLGEDLADPWVRLGYELDHLLCDCQDYSAAAERVRAELPALLPRCRQTAARYGVE